MKALIKKIDKTYAIAIGMFLISWLTMSNSNVLEFVGQNKHAFYVTILLLYMGVFVLQVEHKGEVSDRLLFLGGFILQFIYVFATPYNVSPHDLGYFPGFDSQTVANGHLGYIGYIFNYGHIPPMNPMEIWGYYNPPLHFLLEAIWLRLNYIMGFAETVCLENMQYLTMLYSMLCMCTLYSIINEIGLSEKGKKIWTLGIAFHPFFIFTAGCVNNDVLTLLFTLMAVLYTIKWYKDSTLKNILILALAISLGMMTKLNAALIAPATAFVFLVVLWKRRAEWKKLFVQFIAFGIVCVPLGMWWSVRGLLKYGMPIGYVQSFLSIGGQDVSEYSFLSRMIAERAQWMYPFMSFDNLAYRLDYGIPATLVKSSLFCDQRLFLDIEFGYYFCRALVFITTALFALAAIMVMWKVYEHIRYKLWDDIVFWFACIAIVVQIISYLGFCFGYPNVCSSDFRYVAACLAYLIIFMKENNIQREGKIGVRVKQVTSSFAYCLTILFAVLSVFIYVIYLLAL